MFTNGSDAFAGTVNVGCDVSLPPGASVTVFEKPIVGSLMSQTRLGAPAAPPAELVLSSSIV